MLWNDLDFKAPGRTPSKKVFPAVACAPLVVRPGLQGGTRIDLHSVFLHKNYIHSYSFYWVLLINSRIFVYIPLSV